MVLTPRFLIISAVIHKDNNGQIGGYTPYVREMNLWFKYVEKVRVIAPIVQKNLDPLESYYDHPQLEFIPVPAIEFTSPKKVFISLLNIPVILFQIFKGMIWASHIHLRCPANMGLLGAFVQLFFPCKPKTVKYANNWDWNSKQPLSYRLQQHVLRSSCLTRNTKVLVYGDWKEKSRNILPFYTASYTQKDLIPVKVRSIDDLNEIKLLFVGTVTENKRPLVSVQVLEHLREKGFKASLDVIGDGAQKNELAKYVADRLLDDYVCLHGKKKPDEVSEFFRKAHFLIFISQSEGWPKVVAESMWWGCLPLTTNVSCVKQMVGQYERGVLVEPDAEMVASEIIKLIKTPNQYNDMCTASMNWARQFTLERFEEDIKALLA